MPSSQSRAACCRQVYVWARMRWPYADCRHRWHRHRQVHSNANRVDNQACSSHRIKSTLSWWSFSSMTRSIFLFIWSNAMLCSFSWRSKRILRPAISSSLITISALVHTLIMSTFLWVCQESIASPDLHCPWQDDNARVQLLTQPTERKNFRLIVSGLTKLQPIANLIILLG